jgi:PHP family Zn ribbon phosphoesterase
VDIRKWVLDYGMCQDFDVDDAVTMVRTALAELGTTPNTGSPKLPPCDYCKFELKYLRILEGDNFCRKCGRQLHASCPDRCTT